MRDGIMYLLKVFRVYSDRRSILRDVDRREIVFALSFWAKFDKSPR